MQLTDSQVEEFLKFFKTNSCQMINSRRLLVFMQKVTGEIPKLGCHSGESWMALLQEVNEKLREWNGQLGSKKVFEYENGQVICHSRRVMELFCAPSPVPVESMEAEVEDVKSTVLPAKSVESDDEDVKAAAPSTSQVLPFTPQAMEVNLSARAAQIGELTSDAFAQEYPELCQYYKDMACMSFQMLFERDQLHDYWRGPVMKDGQIVQDVRIIWYGRPVPAHLATLAIRMCHQKQMEWTNAKSFCMRFNSIGCCATAWGCDFLHLCLCCGSKTHGVTSCQVYRKLYSEAQKFHGHFGYNPLAPSMKWTLLALVRSEFKDEESPYDPADPLMRWYDTTDDSKGFEGLGATELREKPEALEAVDSAHLTFMTTEGSVPKEHLKHPRSASIFDPLGFRIDGDTDAVHHGRGVFAASVSLAFRVGSNASDSEEAVDADDAVSFTSTAPSQSGAMKSPLSWTCDEVAKWLQNLDAQYSRYVPEFLKQEISGQSLKDLTLEELKEELQVKQLGPRKIIYAAIQKLFE